MSERGGHWAAQQEVRGLLGMRILLRLYAVGGRGLFKILLMPVILCYYLFAPKPRRASQSYLKRVRSALLRRGMKIPPHLNSYHHFYRFGLTMLDKIASWQSVRGRRPQVVYRGGARDILMGTGRGRLIISSHLGDIEAARAFADLGEHVKVNAVVFTDNAARFKQIMHEFAPSSEANLIAVSTLTPAVACELDDALSRGEYVAIMGDRLSPFKGRDGWRCLKARFLGEEACFPEGPFALATLFDCECVVMHALREEKVIAVYAQRIPAALLKEGSRSMRLSKLVSFYVEELEALTLNHPLEWFNFFDFWADPAAASPQRDHD